ncbi:flagellar filament capping protein FliD [Domibacillus sp. DTU_2020_1001157_1_SI_ALB_TIR_016]|uniref:flagellar filament capping protein FliD n=1 Tax=Domibacillus sp. DTU_2020_1001157_1_SI_ALB_TIR_016 TaxID=3077789 RepID=UPI0028EB1329|nr:flagellar filament capping protein FliD [Domibacillus sp. DTU_2020_1001157_1_SI_ALB_TIR_016]WNS81321.1 flagellar filament capping protein FliD [Domibacillus sp. DTU_2020_1001157_1_SI_ALB_TIR_016]
MVLRVGGMASGMDTESIIKDLMKAERIPLDKLKQKKQTLEWQRDDYRAMNTLLLDFRSELTNMRLTTKYRARTVTSSDDTKVTATASSAASQASYSVTQVDKLATAARQTVSSIGKVESTKTLESQEANFTQDVALTTQTETFATAPSTWQLGKTNLTETDFKLTVDGTVYQLEPGTADANGDYSLKDSLGTQIGTVNLASGVVKFDTPTDLDGKTVTAEYKKSAFAWKTGGVGSQSLVGTGTNTVSLTLATGVNINTAEREAMTVKVNGKAYTLVDKAQADLLDNEVAISSEGILSFKNNIAATDTVSANYITNESTKKYADFSIESASLNNTSLKEKFLIQSTDTLDQVIEMVNKSKAGVSMFYDSFTGGMSLTRTETGNFNSTGKEISVTGDFATKMLLLGGTETGGENAKFVINGLATERSSNTFDMNGVNITLKKEFTSAEGAASLSISNDGNAVFENIKSFVDKYNELIGKISKKTSEERYRTYTPLTDEQRESLSEKQQEQWEEKAKSGLLRRDTILSGVLSSMRSNFSQPVSNSDTDPLFNQLASIGITTTKNYLEGGKLEISESKLKEAINNNPDAVEALFRGGGEATSIGEKGIIHRLYSTVNETMDKLKDRAGNSLSSNQQFTLGRQLTTVDDSITRFEGRLTQVEDRYWKQFTAMEKAIQNANTQSSYLMQQFSSY